MRRRAGTFVISSTILVISFCAVARADGEGQDPPSPQPATKEPPPPLFHKHHRGVYRNTQGLDVLDATPQSPPLETDDPGVPDKGTWEINLTTHADLSKEAQRLDVLLIDANYGMLPTIAGHEVPTQVKLEFPLAAARANGEPFTFGAGEARLGLKFNVYVNEHQGVSLSVYPQIEFAAGGNGNVEKGLADPGQTLIVPLLVSREFRYFILVVNGGVEKTFHDPGSDIAGTVNVAAGRAVTPKLAVMAEVGGESAFTSARDRRVFLNIGAMRSFSTLVAYVKTGHTLAASDDLSHTYLAVGMKLLMQKGR